MSRVDARTPFLMFANSSDSKVFPVLRQFFEARDYVSFRIASQAPALARLIGRSHQFVLPTALDGVRKYSGCGTGKPGLVVYDIEHWNETPVSEQQQPGPSITAAARVTHADKCQLFAVAPDGQYMGLKEGACSYDFDAGIYRRVDWTQVDLVSIQAQRLLSENCAGTLTVEDYAGFVSRAAAFLRSRNPKITVVSQFSFRYTSPGQMVEAMRKAAPSVDGFYLAYPSNQKTPCRYCSPENVAEVLRAWRTGKVQE